MRKIILAALVSWMGVASAAPGFEVQAFQPVLPGVPAASGQQLAESALWREAYLRCAPWLTGAESRDPVQLAAPSFKHMVSDGEQVSAIARFQCGLHDAPDLGKRLASAELVVVGKVIATKAAGIKEPVSEHAASWIIATIAIDEVLKGSPRKTVDVFFSPSMDVAWASRPKLVDGQTGVFVIQPGAPGPQVPERLDVHAAEHRDAIASLLRTH